MSSTPAIPLDPGCRRRFFGRDLSWLAILLFTSLSQMAAADVTMPDGHKVIYRYRSYTGTTPSYVSPITSAGNISHASGSSDILITNRGTGFDDLYATDFDGSTEFIQSASSITTVDSAGKDEFSVQVWFKPANLTGTRSLFSNTESNRGFALKLNGNRLRGIVRFKDGTSYVSFNVDQDAATPVLATGNWYHAILHCRNQGTYYQMRLYLDGVQVGNLTTSSLYDGVYQSSEKPMIGAEPGGGTASGDYFAGQIYAVVVTNYDVFLNNYVLTKTVRDGGRYFGLPSYHDYLDTTATVDYRIDETTSAYANLGTKQVDRMTLPYLNDLYVPQGLAYDPGAGYFYVTYYWRDVDNTVDMQCSIMAEIEKSTNKLRRTFKLLTPGGNESHAHCSGAKFHNGSVYMAFGTSIIRYDMADAPAPYVFNPQTFANPRGDQQFLPAAGPAYAINLQGNTTVSCIDISTDSNGDKILWTTDWDTSAYRKLCGYKINASGDVATTPTYVFNLPVLKAQGVACYSASATELYFYVSTSYHDNPSQWYRIRYTKGNATAQSTTLVFTGPAGTEDLVMIGSQIWSLSESGAKYFQKPTDGSTPWTDLYPFIFGITP